MCADYKPGKCNIGKEEPKKRYFLSLISFLGLIIVLAHVYFSSYSLISAILVFVFSFSIFLNFIQGKQNFCSFYGLKRLYKISGSAAKSPEQGKEKDMYKSVLIMLQSFILATSIFLITLLVF